MTNRKSPPRPYPGRNGLAESGEIPISTPDRHDNLTPAETKQLAKLQDVVERGLDTSVEVCGALAHIRDWRLYRNRHTTFERYLQARWGLGSRNQLTREFAHAWERTIRHFDDDGLAGVEIRLMVQKSPPTIPRHEATPAQRVRLVDVELVAHVRWLISKTGGTIAAIAHQLETRAVDVDEAAREHLRVDLGALEDETTKLKELLAGPIDWDAECRRLLADEVPPWEGGAENEGEK